MCYEKTSNFRESVSWRSFFFIIMHLSEVDNKKDN